ncbi:DUF2237 family protein [Prochlorococcus marinus]|uniref:DUF2237 domain-containing protein n=1 Tax=Prochlorococcus marinus (strain MIT 9211) TaxID=93059 RepID=A9BAF8_PROM4|nr:DUF2237 domain-containing protein [Prochlorococcus marinus]ABX08820.1 Conserved hypothetical protein [Prochlorococcus marinus str. MIT 9211]
MASTHSNKRDLNVLGEPLKICGCKPMTGWFRDGLCKADEADLGEHTICAVMTDSFLSYSKAQGNDLSTPMPEYSFPGLREGDHWCICARRWVQAYEDGVAPQIKLEATHQSVLSIISLDVLSNHMA